MKILFITISIMLLVMSFQEKKGLYAELYRGDEKIDLSVAHRPVGAFNIKIFNEGGEEVDCNFKDIEVIIARSSVRVMTLKMGGNTHNLSYLYSLAKPGDRIIIKLVEVTRKTNDSKIVVSNPDLVIN